jgi:hypothetical protein
MKFAGFTGAGIHDMLTRRSIAMAVAILPLRPIPLIAATDPLHAKPDDRIEYLPEGRCVYTRWIWRDGAWRSVNAVPDA